MTAPPLPRRNFLGGLIAAGGTLALGSSWAFAQVPNTESPYGELLPADANGLMLPRGFSSRIVATTGEPVGGTGHVWHAAPDGGACFATAGGGWTYVSNAEVRGGNGGVGAVEFAADGTVVAARTILSGTSGNCAGGPTPWGTWLSCEETPTGQVWECDPTGATPAVVHPGMGRLWHEAAAVDPVHGVVYLTEDQPDGRFYRYVVAQYPDLSAGTLQVLLDDGGWADVPDPSASSTAVRSQVPGARRFAGGEGAWYHGGIVWFTTKGDGRVWTYDTNVTGPAALTIAYDDSTAQRGDLRGVDNVTVADANGDVFVAEDGGNMEICLLIGGGAAPFLRLVGVGDSEITGPAFSPDGARLYFSSQRNPGRTYEVTGPFRRRGTSTPVTGPSPNVPTTSPAPSAPPTSAGAPGTQPGFSSPNGGSVPAGTTGAAGTLPGC